MLKRGIVIGVIAFLVLWFLRDTPKFPKDGASGKRVLITGASSGIGEHLAYEYAKHGASVFITARRENRLKQVIQKCKTLGRRDAKFGYYVADMKDYIKQSQLLVDAGVKELGGIDTVVVNHLVILSVEDIFWLGSKEDLDSFEQYVGANFNSYVHIVSHALPFLKVNNIGRIGIVGSTAGKLPFAGFTSYNGVKFALDGFFSALRLEMQQSQSGVTVTYGAIAETDTDLMISNLESTRRVLNNSRLNKAQELLKANLETPENVAHQMMAATENGAYELYYPKYTTLIPIPYKLLAILRSVFPNFSIFHHEEESFRRYEEFKKNKAQDNGYHRKRKI